MRREEPRTVERRKRGEERGEGERGKGREGGRFGGSVDESNTGQQEITRDEKRPKQRAGRDGGGFGGSVKL